MTPNINLLPKVEQDDRNAKKFLILVAVVVLILLFVMSWFTRKDVVNLTIEEQLLQSERDGLQEELTVLQGLNQGSLEESVDFVERVSYAITPLIDEAQGLLPDNTYLRSYSFGESTVSFSVDFETLNAISMYIERLERSAYFLDVQVGSIASFELAPDGKEQDSTLKFTEVPRYAVDVTLMINETYLAAGGVNE